MPIKPEHMMSKAQVIREMASHGFVLADESDDLPWQHAMAFRPVAKAQADAATFAAEQVLRGFLRAVRGKDARIVRPFLTTALANDPPPATTLAKLTAGSDAAIALRTADDGAGDVIATVAEHAVALRVDDKGRWRIADVRASAR